MSTERFTRLPKSQYPQNISDAIAIAENPLLRFSSRCAALRLLRDFFHEPTSIPLRPAVIRQLEAGMGCAQ